MSQCQKCGLPLKFEKREGKGGVVKWFPVNPDGSEHWDLCKTTQRARDGVTTQDDLRNHPIAYTWPDSRGGVARSTWNPPMWWTTQTPTELGAHKAPQFVRTALGDLAGVEGSVPWE